MRSHKHPDENGVGRQRQQRRGQRKIAVLFFQAEPEQEQHGQHDGGSKRLAAAEFEDTQKYQTTEPLVS